MLEMLADHSKLDAQVEKTNEEIALVSSLGSACVRENAEKAQAQEEYNDRYDSLVNRYQKAMARLEKLNVERGDRQNRERELQGFIDALTTSPLVLDTWDEQLWRLLVVRGSQIGREALSLSLETGVSRLLNPIHCETLYLGGILINR